MNLVQAEILKLKRRRALMIWTGLLTLGPVLAGYAVLLAMHLSDAARFGPPGGTHNLENVLGVLGALGGIAAIILGTTAGGQDTASGVFRDLVVTGRPRGTLFRVRAAGVLALFAPLYVGAFGLALTAAYAFPAEGPRPDAGRVGQYAAWIVAGMVVTVLLAVSLGSIVSSRVATGVLVAWHVALASALAGIEALGSLRRAIPNVAFDHFLPAVDGVHRVPMSNLAAVLVLAGWSAVALQAGTYRTRRRDA
jgi:ABC-type transport system involved in multi-copper enzyme maturation permease subunit